MATLSERGITFHHKDCEDLHQRHDLQPQQLLNVVWEQDAVWRRQLVLQVTISQETMASILPLLMELPVSIDIQGIESAQDKHKRPVIRLIAGFRNFEDAKTFFSHVHIERVIVERYLRDKNTRR